LDIYLMVANGSHVHRLLAGAYDVA
jgi:hypothetical protein